MLTSIHMNHLFFKFTLYKYFKFKITMKNKHFALIAFLALGILVKGQQAPNAGFETWTNPSKPDGWFTFSTAGFVNLASKDTTDKVEGTASAKIQTANVSFQTIYEILSLGTADFSFNNGYRYNPVFLPFRPDTLFFAYKYNSPGIDTATAYIKLSKGNTILAEATLNLIKSTAWNFPFILLTPKYLNADKPDSILIQFKSSKVRSNFFGVDGSTLNVDNVHFGYKGNSTSTLALKEPTIASIIPNPFSNKLSIFNANNESATISLFNALGQLILQQPFTNSATINTEQMQQGIYFYQLSNSIGTIKSGKIVKQ